MCLFHDWWYSKRDKFATTTEVYSFRTKRVESTERYRSRYCLKCGWKQNYIDRGMLSQLWFWFWAPDRENTPELRRQRASKPRSLLEVEQQDRDELTERARAAWQKEGMEWERRNMEAVKAGHAALPFWMCGPRFDDYYIDRFAETESKELKK